MNAQETYTVVCRKCSANFMAQVWRIVDVGQDQSLKDFILEGKLNLTACPNCGHSELLTIPFIYHDPAHKHIIVVLGQAANWDETAQRAEASRLANYLWTTLPWQARKADYLYHLRITSGLHQLRQVIQRDEAKDEQDFVRLLEDLLACANPDDVVELLQANQEQVDTQFVDRLGMFAAELTDNRAMQTYMIAVQAAKLIRNKPLLAKSLKYLGQTQAAIGRFREAITTQEEAIAAYTELGDRWNQAYCFSRIGLNCEDLEDYSSALEWLERAGCIFHEIGDVQGEALQLGSIGIVYTKLDRLDKALTYHEQACQISRTGGYLEIEASNRTKIGYIQAHRQEWSAALSSFEQALELYKTMESSQGTANTLIEIARVSQQLGEVEQALRYFDEARQFFIQLGLWEGVTEASEGIAAIYQAKGDFDSALFHQIEGLKAIQRLGNMRQTAVALYRIGQFCRDTGHAAKSIEFLNQACDAFRRIDDGDGEASTLHNISITYFMIQEWEAALKASEQASHLFAKMGSEDKEAAALIMAGICAIELKRHNKAVTHLEQAATQSRNADDQMTAISALTNLAKAYRAANRLTEARARLEEAQGLCKNAAEPIVEASVLDELAKVCSQLHDHHAEAQALDKAISLLRAHGRHRAAAVSAIRLGFLYEEMGDMEQAFNQFKPVADALPKLIATDVSPGLTAEFGPTLFYIESLPNIRQLSMPLLFRLGSLYVSRGDPEAAQKVFQSALKLAREGGDEKYEIALHAMNSTLEARLGGDLQQAMNAAQEALLVAERVGNLRGQALALQSRGELHKELGNLPAALRDGERCLEICQELDFKFGEIFQMRHIGLVYRGLGDISNALDYLGRSCQLARSINDQLGLAEALNALGQVYGDVGEWQRALDSYREALTAARQIGSRYVEASILGNRANIYYLLGDYDRALQEHQQALDIKEKTGNRLGQAAELGDMAIVYEKKGEPNQAKKLLEQALEIEHKSGYRRGMAIDLGNLGNISLYQEAFEEAKHFYTEALDICREIGFKTGEAQQLMNLGGVYLLLGEVQQALGYQMKALELLQDLDAPDLLMRAYFNRSWSYQQLGRLEAAYADCQNALNQLETVRRHLALPTHRMLYGTRDDLMVHEHAIELATGLGFHDEAWIYVEKAKSRILAEQLGYQEWPEPANVSPKLLATERQLLNAIRSVDAALQVADSPQQLDILGVRLTELQQELWEVWPQMESQVPEYVALRRGEPVDFDQIRRLVELDKEVGTVGLVEFYTLPDSILVFALRTGWEKPKVKRVSINSEKLFWFYIKNYEREVMKYPRHRAAGLPVTNRWQGLMNPLLSEVIHEFGELDLLYLVPHGLLHYLPMHAFDFEGQPLIERFPIAYAPSASVLNRILHRSHRMSPLISKAMVMGYTPNEAERPLFIGEAKEVAQALGVTPRTDSRATAKWLRKHSGDYTVMHFSCHGLFDNQDPLASSILLADGELTARDIMGLRLNADLVTLSACQTALSDQQPGDELVGLTRALLYAGASSVLVTLWSVNAEAALELMGDFYSLLRGKDGAKVTTEAVALQQAMLEMRKKKEHPYYWAPFILVGDWR